MKLLKKFLCHFLIDTKLDWKHQWELVIVSMTFDYKCHKINPNCGRSYIDVYRSYIDAPDWIKSKKVTINPTSTKNTLQQSHCWKNLDKINMN